MRSTVGCTNITPRTCLSLIALGLGLALGLSLGFGFAIALRGFLSLFLFALDQFLRWCLLRGKRTSRLTMLARRGVDVSYFLGEWSQMVAPPVPSKN